MDTCNNNVNEVFAPECTFKVPNCENRVIPQNAIVDKDGRIIFQQHKDGNRAERRKVLSTKPVQNNREQTKARKGNHLFIKMSRFYMDVTSMKLK